LTFYIESRQHSTRELVLSSLQFFDLASSDLAKSSTSLKNNNNKVNKQFLSLTSNEKEKEEYNSINFINVSLTSLGFFFYYYLFFFKFFF
jgi:hypothetical protein